MNILINALAIVALFAAPAVAQEKINLSIGTGGTGGVYYPLGGGLANVLSKHVPGMSATAEGALSKVTDSLQRMRELAVQSANATNTTADRGNLNAEFQQLNSEVSRTISSTRFNGLAVIGSDAGGNSYQVGEASTDRVTFTTTNLGTNTTITAVGGNDITSQANASTAMANIDAALSTVNVERASYGAYQNRFEAIISTLQVAVTNNSASRGRIMDADFAAETANMSRAQILQQAGTAMMAQANQAPQQVMSLLRG